MEPIPLREIVESDLLTVQDPEHLGVHTVRKKRARAAGLAPGTGGGAALAAYEGEERDDGRNRSGRPKEHAHERHLVLERIRAADARRPLTAKRHYSRETERIPRREEAPGLSTSRV